MQFDGATNLNDPSTTKQMLNGTTNIVVLASEQTQSRYYHGELDV